MLYDILNVVDVISYFFLNAVVYAVILVDVAPIVNNEIMMFDVGL